MSERELHVIVVGGGIGGLCLAQGLKWAGVGVADYERDLNRTDRLEGYRLHINPAGSRALHACLPSDSWEAFVATAGEPGGFAFLDEQLEELAFIDEEIMYWPTTDPAESHHAADRVTLRQLLLAGLDDVVHFGKKFERYEHTPEGKVTAFFADGTSATGDVLVGADGANSGVRAQYLPGTRRVETDAVAVGHKLPLTDETMAWLSPRLATGMNSILAPEPYFMFTAVFERKQDPVEAPAASGGGEEFAGLLPELLANHTRDYGDYVLCAFVAHRDAYPPGVQDLDGSGLRRLVQQTIEGWHPDLRRLVAESDPDSVTLVPIKTSVPVEGWKSTNVTLLGDAIHSMPPLAGLGGNTALRDANLLYRKLTAVHAGKAPLLTAIREYEAEMSEYGFAAVHASLRNTRQAISNNRFALAAFKTVLRLCQTVPPLKRLMFRNTWAEHARARPWELSHPVDRAKAVNDRRKLNGSPGKMKIGFGS